MKKMNIEELLEKYFNAETSFKEEEELKEYFEQNEIPAQLEPYRELFSSFNSYSKEKIEDEYYEDKIIQKIDRANIRTFKNISVKFAYIAAGVAAALLILLMAYVQYSTLPDKNFRLDYLSQDTYKDPNKAYAETKNTLLYVSAELNKGLDQLDKISEFDKSIEKVQKNLNLENYQQLNIKGAKKNEN
jgi:hypothetical protein